MTGFLASISLLEEACIALEGGVDVIDLKDPSIGILGAVPVSTLREVVEFVAGRRLVSATIGDLPDEPEVILPAVAEVAATGVNIIKVGFFNIENRDALLEALAGQACIDTRIIAVLFADRESNLEGVLSNIADCGLMGAMLDTADKRGGSLRTYRTDLELAAFMHKARELGLVTGLAGSLDLEDISPLLALAPDYLGFRGALCLSGLRQNTIDPIAVREVRTRIPQEPSKLISNPSCDLSLVNLASARHSVHGLYGI